MAAATAAAAVVAAAEGTTRPELALSETPLQMKKEKTMFASIRQSIATTTFTLALSAIAAVSANAQTGLPRTGDAAQDAAMDAVYEVLDFALDQSPAAIQAIEEIFQNAAPVLARNDLSLAQRHAVARWIAQSLAARIGPAATRDLLAHGALATIRLAMVHDVPEDWLRAARLAPINELIRIDGELWGPEPAEPAAALSGESLGKAIGGVIGAIAGGILGGAPGAAAGAVLGGTGGAFIGAMADAGSGGGSGGGGGGGGSGGEGGEGGDGGGGED